MKRLIAVLFSAVLLMAVPGSASGAVYQYSNSAGSCTQHWHNHGDTLPFMCLTDSANHSGRKLILTGSSDIADLSTIAHGGEGLCPPVVIGGDTWNDCITSVWVKLGANDSFCLHSGSGYYGWPIWWAAAPSSPSIGVWTYSTTQLNPNDTTSSVRLQQSGTDCPYL